MSAFHWQGRPSCLATPAEARKAAQHAKSAGKLLNSSGFATVDLAPATDNQIHITSAAESARTQRIARGTSR